MYSYNALLLSGTPSSGKDTLTAALHELDPRIVPFRKHRAGPGGQGTNAYLDISQTEFDEIAANDGFAQWHSRYGRSYGISRVELQASIARGLTPVIHVGKYENLLALRSDVLFRPALSILLLCSREETHRRLEARHAGNDREVSARLSAFDEERETLKCEHASRGALDFNLVLDTKGQNPRDLAEHVRIALMGETASGSGNRFQSLSTALER